MSIAIKNFHKATELKEIQKVRMMIGVINMSDISTSDVRSMDKSFILSRQNYRRRNGHKWPLKHNILSTNYTIWRKLLKKIFCEENYQLPNKLRR